MASSAEEKGAASSELEMTRPKAAADDIPADTFDSVESGERWLDEQSYDVKAVAMNLLIISVIIVWYIHHVSILTYFALYGFILCKEFCFFGGD
jgi:hypothetical protein